MPASTRGVESRHPPLASADTDPPMRAPCPADCAAGRPVVGHDQRHALVAVHAAPQAPDRIAAAQQGLHREASHREDHARPDEFDLAHGEGSQRASSAGSGLRFPGGRHFNVLAMKTCRCGGLRRRASNCSARNMLSRSWPDLPTKGSPRRSSCSPGASPTIIQCAWGIADAEHGVESCPCTGRKQFTGGDGGAQRGPFHRCNAGWRRSRWLRGRGVVPGEGSCPADIGGGTDGGVAPADTRPPSPSSVAGRAAGGRGLGGAAVPRSRRPIASSMSRCRGVQRVTWLGAERQPHHDGILALRRRGLQRPPGNRPCADQPPPRP